MNRINQLFDRKRQGLLSLYFCAGHPTPDSTANIIETLYRNRIDLVEVGIPFTDPMADGPVIQDAATKALRNGMTLRKIFGQVKEARDHGVEMPLILMGYLNPIYHMGYKEFFERCRKAGVDGVIIPDLPFKDYLEEVKPVADKHDIRVIMLITPETSDERIRFIDEHTDGFIYMVSSASTTGAQKEFDLEKQAYFNKVNDMSLKHPRMIGFGISNKQTLESAQANAAGAIIGSKFVTLLDELQDPQAAVDSLRDALGK
ncbi:MAG TPA: tryptophan synthase subunit alpha [Prevotellaceae bacterium]|nr:tryptophan synthase subunit alpha [Prevotellaceae bacterium]